MVALHRLHVRLPYDADYSVLTGMVSIFKPKTRNRGARVQGTVITDELVLWLADAVWGRLPKHTALCRGGRLGLLRRFQHILYLLHLEGSSLTLGSLRAGGAVAYVSAGGTIGDLQFRGRWEVTSTLLHYVQEASAVSVLFDMPVDARSRVASLSNLLPALIFNDPMVVSRGGWCAVPQP